jgi:hypothetical protein
MRRHAEGLLIVAGGSSGRSWREPVPVVDVMRAAIAEVEDYTRIRVMSRTSGSIAGHAVADVIHLLAELLENATMFSPAWPARTRPTWPGTSCPSWSTGPASTRRPSMT